MIKDSRLVRNRVIEAVHAVEAAVMDSARDVRAVATDGHVCVVPTQTGEQEHPPTTGIELRRGTGAIDAGLAALVALEYQDGQHPQATRRAPGLIVVNADVSAAIARVNTRKAELENAMKALGRGGWEYWHSRIPAFQRLQRLQAYRRWRWLDRPVARLGLSWAGFDHSITQVRLARVRHWLGEQIRATDHPRALAEQRSLAELDANEVVAIRRPVAPSTLANVKFADGHRQPFKTTVPMIAPGPLPDHCATLNDFDIEARRPPRSDQALETEPLNTFYRIWRYRPPFRFHLPADPVSASISLTDGVILIACDGQTISLGPAGDLETLAEAVAERRGTISPSAPALSADGRARVIGANTASLYVACDQAVWRIERTAFRRTVRAAMR